MTWKPAKIPLKTSWGKNVSPENAWQKYPRPQMVRKEWKNLNGLWEYAISKKKEMKFPEPQGEILVPFAIESALSGVKRTLKPDERLWYRRKFILPKNWQNNCVLLHFGAVDWEATVWLNDTNLGVHTGGYLPFYFDISEALQPGENELVVSVWDPTDASWQQRGKQVRKPHGIWYTQVSGIWQTVWLEPVPSTYIKKATLTPDIDKVEVLITVELEGQEKTGMDSSVTIFDEGKKVATGRIPAGKDSVRMKIRTLQLWSPATPHLYDVAIKTGTDQIRTYFGMRKFSLGKDAHGCTRMLLNNQPYFQYGPLDQGYWPDGLYTPPSEEAMRFDLKLVKTLGFNMLRKHIKVEPARYYFDCDRMGIIVWQDMVNGGKTIDEVLGYLAFRFRKDCNDHNYRNAGRQLEESRKDFRRELREMIDHLSSFACIGVWVPFNEGWGQFDAREIAEWIHEYDPTRLVDHASGWYDQGGGDFQSVHVYFSRLDEQSIEKNRVAVISEFGGKMLKIPGHVWNPNASYVYQTYNTKKELTDAYVNLLQDELLPLIDKGLSAAIYTQTTDVEIEVNGFVTYDRKVEKMSFTNVRQAHQAITGHQATRSRNS